MGFIAGPAAQGAASALGSAAVNKGIQSLSPEPGQVQAAQSPQQQNPQNMAVQQILQQVMQERMRQQQQQQLALQQLLSQFGQGGF